MSDQIPDPAIPLIQQLFNNLPESLILVDMQGRITDWNSSAEHLLGWPRDQAVGRMLHELILPPHFHLTDADTPAKLFTGGLRRDNSKHIEISVNHAYGHEIPVELSIVSLETEANAGAAIVLRDISARKQNEFMLQMQRHILEMIATGKDVQSILDELCILIEIEVPKAICSVMRYDETEQSLRVLAGPHLPDVLRDLFAGLQPGENRASCGTAFHTRKPVFSSNTTTDPRWKDFQHIVTEYGLHACWSIPIHSGKDLLGTFAISLPYHAEPGLYEKSLLETASWLAGIALTHDMNQQHIHRLAMHDDLTGLPNRKMLLKELSNRLDHAVSDRQAGAVMFLDLDNFKTINDNMGHRIGDEVLRETTRRLTRLLSNDDLAARMGGDEFIVVQQDSSPAKARRLAEQIRESVSQVMNIDLLKVHVTTSIGIALFPDDAMMSTNLLKHADTAMYMAKNSGRNNIQFYLPVMDGESVSQNDMQNLLTTALRSNQLSSLVQPIVSVADNRYLGTEILLRWQHPTRGMLDATEFLPLVDKLGLTRSFGSWALRESARLITEYSEDFPIDREHRLSVNISSRYFLMDEFDEDLKTAFRDVSCDLDCLLLEITLDGESSDYARLSERLRDYHRQKAGLAIDNLGTELVSLYSQGLLPVDYIKLDVSLVRDIPLSYSSAKTLESLIHVAHANKQQVIAVGIETSGQLDFIRNQGCDAYQGYLYCGPMEADELITTLRTPNHTGKQREHAQ